MIREQEKAKEFFFEGKGKAVEFYFAEFYRF